MHLAFVTSLVTDGKPTTGFEVANEAIVAGLRATGCKVTVIGFRLPRQRKVLDDQTIVLQTLDVENANSGTMQKISWMVGALIAGLPVGGSKLTVLPWQKVKAALDGAGPFDGLIINSVQIATAFPQLLDYGPYAYVAHNVEHHSAQQNAQSSGGRMERLLYARDARLLEPIEMRLCDKASHVFVLSDDDAESFGLDGQKATTLPLIFPVGEGHSDLVKVNQTHDVGLIGTWSWQPNFVGLTWFLDHVVPLLDSNIEISIAGNTPDIATRPDHKGLRFVGRVDDADEFVSASRVLALVSRSGTGVQLKTIEAFQSGMPCIATHSSVRGISGIPENCRVEDDGRAFANSLNEMVKAVRAGRMGRIDGEGFAQNQRKCLQQALEKGLAGLKK